MPTPIEQLKAIRDGYLNALAQDALAPFPSHTIDQVSVDANTWRKELLARIGQINELICAFDPVEQHSVIV